MKPYAAENTATRRVLTITAGRTEALNSASKELVGVEPWDLKGQGSDEIDAEGERCVWFFRHHFRETGNDRRDQKSNTESKPARG